jgi:probable RNA-binding protein EIF1AD
MGRKSRIVRQVLDDFPVPTDTQALGIILAPRGKNIHEVMLSSGETTLTTIPPKFRNLIFVRRGK